MRLITSAPHESPARVRPSTRPPLTVGVVQTRWHADPAEHLAMLNDGIRTAANAGAHVVFLSELTLARYPADRIPDGDATASAEDLTTGPTYAFAAAAAAEHGIAVHASLFERADGPDGLGYNTAILVAPDRSLLGRTRKMHIPITAGYYENRYFRPGPTDGEPYTVVDLPGDHEARLGLPTCWDQWFPELARLYSLNGADILASSPFPSSREPDRHRPQPAQRRRELTVRPGFDHRPQGPGQHDFSRPER
ncbi:N-carbamoylputrescine amidase [Kibdelosporangium banguiense]|uniref:N-carbamoylputrescine amidase n=1 Tax=Kibdelosporangium banguiense TaxID=1365924 RepID=A0ABS4TXV4_9PSEU|nr:N-carbamoylputrescine amidase [Kibdelosporangium banguiense]